MILVNFSHPISEEQSTKLAELLGRPVDRVVDVASRIELNVEEIAPQVDGMIESAGLSSVEWQTEQIVINPPALAPIAAVTLAKLHGLMGYFPSILRISPRPGVTPPVFDVAEIIDLQVIRQDGRSER